MKFDQVRSPDVLPDGRREPLRGERDPDQRRVAAVGTPENRDPVRVAIFGGCCGGYATLVGVTFTPERFAAAVEYVGISNLANFMRTVPEFAKPGTDQQLVPLRG